MTKQFEYKGYQFIISVELNTGAERHIGGKRFHTITTRCINIDGYNNKVNAEDAYLVRDVTLQQDLAKKFVDAKSTIPIIDKRLVNLGFK